MKLLLLFVSLFFVACTPQQTKPLHSLELTAEGVSGLKATTPFRQIDIAPKLPGYDLSFFTAFEAGIAKKVIEVSFYGQQILYITPKPSKKGKQSTINSIHIVSKLVTTPFDIKIGEYLREEKTLHCQENTKYKSCTDTRFANIELLFFPHTNKEYKLQEIVWRADALY